MTNTLKFIIVFIFALFLNFSNKASIYAHPLDNTDTYIQIENNYDNTKIEPNSVKVYSYISWYIAGVIFYNNSGNEPIDFEELQSKPDYYQNYALQNILLKNNGKDCVSEITPNAISDSLSQGALVLITFTCPDVINDVEIKNTLANDIFELPTNFITVQTGETILEKISLGKESNSILFNYPTLKQNPVGDVSVDYSAGYTYEDVVNSEVKKENSSNSNSNGAGNGPKSSNILTSITDVLFLRAENVKNQSLLVLVAIVFLLGFLHTLEAGHSKMVLTSNLLNNKINFKQALLYVFVFTATHLGDIVVVGILFLVLDNFYDVFSNFKMIERFALFAVFFLALYMFIKSLLDYFKHKYLHVKNREHHHHDMLGSHSHNHYREDADVNPNIAADAHSHSHTAIDITTNAISEKGVSIKSQILIGILTGIAPCIFGWSIFMLVVSTGNLLMLFPVILSFGVGIFTALTLVAFFVTKVRSATFSKLNFLSEISPIISALFLLIYSIVIILR